jgi:hypothetical protein
MNMAFVKWRRITFSNELDAMFSSFSSSPFTPPHANILLNEVQVLNTTLITATPPGTGNAVSYQFAYGNNVALTPPITISGLSTTVSFTATNAIIPALADSYISVSKTGTPPFVSANVATAFQDTHNKFVSYYAIGGTSNTSGLLITNLSTTPTFFGMVAFTTPNETQAQTPWPVTGKFKNFYVQWNQLASGNTASVVLRKNGADTALAFNLTGIGGFTLQSITDSTTQIPVSIGDLVNWKVVRTSGTGTQISLYISYGFSTV